MPAALNQATLNQIKRRIVNTIIKSVPVNRLDKSSTIYRLTSTMQPGRDQGPHSGRRRGDFLPSMPLACRYQETEVARSSSRNIQARSLDLQPRKRSPRVVRHQSKGRQLSPSAVICKSSPQLEQYLQLLHRVYTLLLSAVICLK